MDELKVRKRVVVVQGLIKISDLARHLMRSIPFHVMAFTQALHRAVRFD